ncbi:MAG: hypothetical protein KF866_10045 [Phycisphaeraceae bacterium]|nr:hypothetical protein [Phycisphaeraceae bacterium]
MLLWGLGLLGIAVLLIVIEIFVPSGGVIAVTAGAVTIAGVICLFIADPVWGVAGLLAVLIAGPIIIMGALNVWKSTPLGKRMMGVPSDEEVQQREEAERRRREELASMVGNDGEALTALRPVGAVRIDGKRFDAVAELDFIEPGERVRVTHADGLQIKVRRV